MKGHEKRGKDKKRGREVIRSVYVRRMQRKEES